MTHTTNDAPVTVEAVVDLIEMLGVGTTTGAFDHTPDEIGLHVMENAQAVLAALASAPAADESLAVAIKQMSAAAVKAAVRGWLDADDPTHWGAFETALDAAVNETSERARIVAMLRADADTMRANAVAYSEEAPSDARALNEVAATLNFKAAQIERGDHMDQPSPAPAGDGVEEARAIILRHSEKWVAEYAEREGGLPDTMVFRLPFVEKLLAASLDRPRAAVGEHLHPAVMTEVCDAGRWSLAFQFGKGDDARDRMRAAADAFRRALQSPPAKVEG